MRTTGATLDGVDSVSLGSIVLVIWPKDGGDDTQTEGTLAGSLKGVGIGPVGDVMPLRGIWDGRDKEDRGTAGEKVNASKFRVGGETAALV